MGQIINKYPTYLRIESVQGCTRSCFTCPASCKKSEHRFMTKEIFDKCVLPNINNKIKRIEFAMHGEPLLNSNLEYFISSIRNKENKIQISIISNGDLLTFKRTISLFDTGLNFLHVDIYDKKAKERFIIMIKTNKQKFIKEKIDTNRFIKGGINIWKYSGGKHRTILMSDESLGFNKIEKHIIRRLHTFGGNIPLYKLKDMDIDFNLFPMNKKCTEPMKCAPIDIHGNIVLCCADANKSIVCGNLNHEKMKDIWNGSTFQKARFLLSKGRRDLIPCCYFCNRISFRVGLFPYKGIQYDYEKLKEIFFKKTKYSNNLLELFKNKGVKI